MANPRQVSDEGRRSAPLPRKTRKSWNEPGHAHFLTYSCYKRLPLLASNRAKRWVVDAIDDARIRLDFAVWAFVIMPEHVHILLCPLRPQYEMRTILVGLKRPVSDAARRYLESQGHSKWLDRLLIGEGPKQKFRFWQSGGGFDRNVTHERTIPSIVDYIHGNPVRRGLVSTPADWRWSSAAFWEGRADGPIKLDRPLTR